jgi:hypothetical protein
MRDIPVQFFVLRERNRGAHYFRNCLQPKKASRAEQKKEEPRGNGARSGEKQ